MVMILIVNKYVPILGNAALDIFVTSATHQTATID